MKVKILSGVILAVVIVLTFTTVAFAASSNVEAILKDALDGRIDGHWTKAEIQAALIAVRNDPTYQQYTDVEGVLDDYLASLAAPGEQGNAGQGELMFTGGPVVWLFALGTALMAGGFALRRLRTS
jgi:hypothetical protein